MLVHYLYTITSFLKLIKYSYLKLYLVELKMLFQRHKVNT